MMQLNPNNPATLGLPEAAVELAKEFFRSRHPFLILIGGSPRSGRSTTMSALTRLHALCHIPGSETGRQSGLPALPISLVRIEDLHDAKAARCAVEVMRTGYGLVATMAAGCPWSALRKFHELGDHSLSRMRDIVGFAGVLVIYQALMSKLCPRCSVPSFRDTGIVVPGNGCDYCRDSSYCGETLVSDFLHVTLDHSLFTVRDEDRRQYLFDVSEGKWMRGFSRRCTEALLGDTKTPTDPLLNGTQTLSA